MWEEEEEGEVYVFMFDFLLACGGKLQSKIIHASP
jgi:hypothetical protein